MTMKVVYFYFGVDTCRTSDRPIDVLRDEELRGHIQRVWRENFCAYGARENWKQLK